MDTDLLLPLGLGAVGIVVAGTGLVTYVRRWPGLIAGFDAERCSDIDGLTRWVGSGGLVLGGLCVLGAMAAVVLPNHRTLTSAVLAMSAVLGAIVLALGCGRFVRR